MNDIFQFNDDSLERHEIHRQDAIELIESERSVFFPLSRRNGNDRLMFVGFIHGRAVLLEIGVEFLPNGIERIFHANKARKNFVHLYNSRKHL